MVPPVGGNNFGVNDSNVLKFDNKQRLSNFGIIPPNCMVGLASIFRQS